MRILLRVICGGLLSAASGLVLLSPQENNSHLKNNIFSSSLIQTEFAESKFWTAPADKKENAFRRDVEERARVFRDQTHPTVGDV